MTSVLLFRDAADEDPYRAAFEAAGYAVYHQAVLHFRPSNHDALLECLSNPDQYAGIIITSARALGPLMEVLDAHPDLKNSWASRPFFAVGPASAARAEEQGFIVEGKEAGNAKALAEHVAHHEHDVPWLFLCRRCHCKDLPRYLVEHSKPVETLVVYESSPVTDLQFEGTEPGWALFFSPAGARVAREAWPAHWQRVRFGAIGPRTADTVEALFGRVDAVANTPTADAVLDAVKAAGLAPP